MFYMYKNGFDIKLTSIVELEMFFFMEFQILP